VSGPPPAAADAAPLAPAALAQRLAALGPFEARPELAVAVSGGADSLALALLAREWVAARGGRLLALVVDHDLRPGSDAAAATAAAWLAARGIAAAILRWEGSKPATGVQATARDARYRLLETACRERGILHLLLAHHAGDQAETVAMRAARGSGPFGLAGMAAVVERPGLRLLRPFLDLPKARLVATLRAAGQPWLEDPSNRDERFRRGALRADPGFDPAPWWRQAVARTVARAAADKALARFLAGAARPHPLGQLVLDRGAWEALPAGLRAEALARALLAVGGQAYPVAPGRIGQLPGQGRLTLGGCVVASRDGLLLLAREPGRIADRRTVRPGGELWWDRRFVVRYEAGPGPLTLAPLGEAGRRLLPRELRQRCRAAGVSTCALAALPALWDADRLVACPPLKAPRPAAATGVIARATLRPAAALAGPGFSGVNVVSNRPRPIYPPRAGAEPVPGTFGAAPR
jgi:tRNA(Ile)-lysidine synthase